LLVSPSRRASRSFLSLGCSVFSSDMRIPLPIGIVGAAARPAGGPREAAAARAKSGAAKPGLRLARGDFGSGPRERPAGR
jgi:hypothetical protein